MISGDHPFHFLQAVFGRTNAVFEFSRYVYTPDSLLDEREIFEVSGAALSEEWLESQIGKLRSDQELAIHSRVRIAGRTLHIPMLDFAASEIGPDQLDRIRVFLPRQVFRTSAFYCSGRSFHAYSTTLLNPKAWSIFLGRSLLINPSDGETIVDTRWVGHRLIAGYCSLRLSNNSHQYRGMPRRIDLGASRAESPKYVPASPDETWEQQRISILDRPREAEHG